METSLVDFMGMLVVGSLMSLFIQWIKHQYGASSRETKLLTIVLSIAIGGFYFLLRDTIWYQTIVGILTAASTVYALLLKK